MPERPAPSDRCCTCRTPPRGAGLCIQRRDFEVTDRDDVGEASGVDPELVPGHLGQDADPGLLFHLVLDSLVVEVVPDRIGGEREADHPLTAGLASFTTTGLLGGPIVAAGDDEKGQAIITATIRLAFIFSSSLPGGWPLLHLSPVAPILYNA